MIVSKSSPSLLWSAIATTIHTKSFNCFVSTARHAFLWKIWSTQVYLGDPAIDRDFKMYCRVIYAKGFKKQKVYAGHDDLARVLNIMGQDGFTLPQAVDSIFDIWFYHGAIRPVFLDTWMGRSGFVNEVRPLPSWLRE